ncbi:late virion membrane protein [Bovine papular stomatitis virus]|uniref:Late virion membrane protein n=1 Tax=Bovine papular stomatitis virus TaxID=129727 RepID=A0A0E3XBW3_9POXV|nr:late virion membrane protein [Bovine papular stomatitis virus]AKC03383.1 late virion membrane protein [Bovine papular stomatitis virus]
MRPCYVTVIKSIGGLALFQVANGAIDLMRHLFMHFCEHRLRSNTLAAVLFKTVISMIMYLLLGVALIYMFSDSECSGGERPAPPKQTTRSTQTSGS